MAVKINRESFKDLTKQEFYDIVRTYLKDNLNASINKMRDEDNFSLPSWSEYQAYQLGYQKALEKVLDYIPNLDRGN